jgi:4-aminobutyrate aminotransferase
MAKGIASGMPLGAIVAKADVMDWEYGSHASTYGGNPIACAAALKVIELLEGGLIDNSAKMGEYLMGKLKEMQKKFPVIGDIRGKGLMVGLELIEDQESMKKASGLRNRIVNEMVQHGVILIGCGENTLRFAPPLIVTKDEIDVALEIFEQVLEKLTAAVA